MYRPYYLHLCGVGEEVAGYRLFLLLFLMHMLTQGARWFYKRVPYIPLTYVYHAI
jgi:hypothetical protein